MPLKSFAVSKYTKLVLNTQPGWFSFNEYRRCCNTRDQPGCIEADSLSGSYFQIYFHDKHLFQTHHVPSPLSDSRVTPGERLSVAAKYRCKTASRQWTLIILYDNNNSRFLSGARKENFETCNLPPALRRLQCKKGQNRVTTESSEP